jgi:hypothetical protein
MPQPYYSKAVLLLAVFTSHIINQNLNPMKKLLVLLLFITPIYCFAQADSLKYKPKEEFCEVQFASALGGKFVVTIDNGNDNSDKATSLKDADGNKRKFKSVVSILNYMAQYGWVLVTSYSDVFQGATDGTHLLYKRAL